MSLFNDILSGWEDVNSAAKGTVEVYNQYEGGGTDSNTATTPAPGATAGLNSLRDANYPERSDSYAPTSDTGSKAVGQESNRTLYLVLAGTAAAVLTAGVVAYMAGK